jgi:hypothetical protein
MQTILIAGVLNQPFGSWPAASQSNDGQLWTQASSPFSTNDFCTALATDGTTAAVSNQRGYLSTTTDMTNWVQTVINDGFGTTDLAQSVDANSYPHWIAVGSYNYVNGYGPYPPKTSVAQIYRSNSATEGWHMVWTHPLNGSEFYQVSYFALSPITDVLQADVWVAVGSNGAGGGDVYYSLDYGISWVQAPIPAGAGTIYSVGTYQLDGTTVWLYGSSGKIFISSTLNSVQWNEVELNSGDNIIGITSNETGSMVLNGVNNLYITFNGLEYSTFNQLGYVFNRVLTFNYDSKYRWLAFARSTLTQFTYWLSDDLITWSSGNNGIEVQGTSTNS